MSPVIDTDECPIILDTVSNGTPPVNMAYEAE